MLRRSGKGASEEDCSEHALSQGMSASRTQGLDLLLSRDHDNDYTCNLLWIWTRIYKQSVSTFEVNFHIWKDWVCNDCARRRVICTHCSHKQSSLPLSCSPSGEEITSGTCMYIAISCKVGFWSLFVLPPLPWGWSCSSHTPPSCDESLPAPPSRFDPPAENFC